MVWVGVVERLRRLVQQQREATELAQLNECELAEIRACQTAAEQDQIFLQSGAIKLSQQGKLSVPTIRAKADEA